jgi:prepilin-type N-terminal cleavage/methylation domain-containing protein
MTFSRSAIKRQKGFTLLEILITITFAAILGAMLIQFLGTSMTQSAAPVMLTKEAYTLNQIIEKMTAHYKMLMVTDTDPLATFKLHIENGNNSGNSPYFGEYAVQTSYITLNGGVEAPDASGGNRLLKVTLTVNRQSLAALFTR